MNCLQFIVKKSLETFKFVETTILWKNQFYI